MRYQTSTVPHSTTSHSVLDRTRLPEPDDFFRQNLEGYRRYGSRARARCPFHPAPNHRSRPKPFSIHLTRGLWFCHSCNLGGDIIEFIKRRDNCSFIEAAKSLGAWRPLSQTDAKVYWHARNAQQARQQRRNDNFRDWLELLLKEMEIYESFRDWAFRHHHDELVELIEQLITAVGGDYVLLKAGML
jgi:hypothetical protein